MTTPEQFIARMKSDGRVRPQPLRWNELWDLLPGRKRVGVGWETPLPRILVAWHHASDAEKRQRLHPHLRWAEKHDVLDQAINFLKSLPAPDWHTVS